MPKNKPVEAVIRLHSYNPCILTTAEFAQLKNEAVAHAISDPTSLMLRVIAKLVLENDSRYHEALEQNIARGLR